MVDIVENSLKLSLEMMYDDPGEALIVEDNDTKHKC